MAHLAVITVAGPGLGLTVQNVRKQQLPGLEHLIVGSPESLPEIPEHLHGSGVRTHTASGSPGRQWNSGLSQVAADFAVFLPAGARISRGFLLRAVDVLTAQPNVGLVAPGKPRPGGVRDFQITRQLVRDELPVATVFRTRLARPLDSELGSYALWDLWLGILGQGAGVQVLGRFNYRGPARLELGPEAPSALTELMQRNRDLYSRHAEPFWAEVLAQRPRVWHLKSRFGRIEDGLHALARRVRRARA